MRNVQRQNKEAIMYFFIGMSIYLIFFSFYMVYEYSDHIVTIYEQNKELQECNMALTAGNYYFNYSLVDTNVSKPLYIMPPI